MGVAGVVGGASGVGLVVIADNDGATLARKADIMALRTHNDAQGSVRRTFEIAKDMANAVD